MSRKKFDFPKVNGKKWKISKSREIERNPVNEKTIGGTLESSLPADIGDRVIQSWQNICELWKIESSCQGCAGRFRGGVYNQHLSTSNVFSKFRVNEARRFAVEFSRCSWTSRCLFSLRSQWVLAKNRKKCRFTKRWREKKWPECIRAPEPSGTSKYGPIFFPAIFSPVVSVLKRSLIFFVTRDALFHGREWKPETTCSPHWPFSIAH